MVRLLLHRGAFAVRSVAPGKLTPGKLCSMLSTQAPLGAAAAAAADPVGAVLSEIYLSGHKGHVTGQPKVVLAVTGGGGSLVGALLSQPGASSCVLEVVVPYSRQSCLDFLSQSGRTPKAGFCSDDMALALAKSARDRALELEPVLRRWPNVHGVSCTATIVSHYTRRGDYRVHAAAARATGAASTYKHTFVKGHRDRAGEDRACGLLACRAMADSCGAPSAPTLASYGVRLEDIPGHRNEVGEEAEGVEHIPDRVVSRALARDEKVRGGGKPYVLVAGAGCAGGAGGAGSSRSEQDTAGLSSPHSIAVVAPGGRLPLGSVLAWCGNGTGEQLVRDAALVAQEALVLLGRQGDGKTGFAAADATEQAADDMFETLAAAAAVGEAPSNWGVLGGLLTPEAWCQKYSAATPLAC